MLTADLIRAKNYKGVITPRWVDRDDKELLDRVQLLVDAFATTNRPTRKAIEVEIDGLVGDGTDFMVWRGVSKLLMDRSEFVVDSQVDPVELRRLIFEATGGRGAADPEHREAILTQVGDVLGLSPQACAQSMYADLDERHVLATFKKTDAQKILDRYNLALAQACLYKARNIKLSVRESRAARLRYLFQNLKFFGLMHTITRQGKTLEITVDGPVSLFSQSTKYGFSLAKFLPALVHMREWTLDAELEWKKGKNHTMSLSNEDPLVSHYRLRGQWISDEESWFEKRFAKKCPDWQLERSAQVIALDRGQVWVPSYKITSPEGDVTFAEVIGYWRAGYLDSRVQWLASAKESLILIVAERLGVGREALKELPVEVVFYKSSILPEKVAAAARLAHQ